MSDQKRGRAANGRSSIYQDGVGRWHGWVSMGTGADGRKVRRHVTATSRSEVTLKVRALEQQRDSGAVASSGRRPTVSEYLDGWISRRASLDVRPSTVAGYRTDSVYVRRTLGHLRIDRLSPTDIERLWTEMTNAGVLPSVAHVRRTLGACLEDAVRDGLLLRNPVKSARTPRHEPPEIVPLDVSEVRAFLNSARKHPNGPRWTLAAVLGLRQGEVLGLHWSDLDPGNATLTVKRQLRRATWQHGCGQPAACAKRGADCPERTGGGLRTSEPKSRAGRRVIGLPASVLSELVDHRRAQAAEQLAAEYWVEGDWIFANPWGGPIDQRRDWAAFKAILREAGLRDVRLHDLRHSSATLMLESEIDLRTAGQILGHSNTSQTSRYTHVLADRRRVAADRIEATLWGVDSTA